jgi:prolyl oligopeptidase
MNQRTMDFTVDPRPTLDAPDDDPWTWLEEVEDDRALAWVEAQNSATLARLADARYEADRDAVKAALDRPDKLPFINRLGGLVYNFWQEAEHPRGFWRRTTLQSYRDASPDWELLLDLDALAETEGEDWVFRGGVTRPDRHDRAILHLSRGGRDACVLREYDIAGQRFVPGGFTLSQAKGGAMWLDDDTLLLTSAWGEGMATASGYARAVRRWSRGTDPAAAPVIFECDPASMGVGVQVDRETPGRLIFFERRGFYEAAVHLGDRDGPRRRVELPLDAEFTWQHDWLAVRPRSPWTIGGVTHAPDTLLGTRLSAVLSDQVHFEVLFSPAERRALQGFFWCAGRLVLSVLDDLRPSFLILEPTEERWRCTVLQGLPRNGVASVRNLTWLAEPPQP